MRITGFDHQTIEDRLEGFNSHINHPDIIHYSQVETQQDGYDLVPTLIKEQHIDTKTTFIFVTNDNVAIIGYDNIRICAISRVPLTTISQSITESGEIAATNLLKLITTKETAHTLIEPFLVQRESG